MRTLLPQISEYTVAPQSQIQHLTKPPLSSLFPSPPCDRPLQPQASEGNISKGRRDAVAEVRRQEAGGHCIVIATHIPHSTISSSYRKKKSNGFYRSQSLSVCLPPAFLPLSVVSAAKRMLRSIDRSAVAVRSPSEHILCELVIA